MKFCGRKIVMESISIRVAGESDSDNIVNFKNLYFHNSEPMELAHPESGHSGLGADYIFDAIKNGTVLVATEASSNTLVGVLIADTIESSKKPQISAIKVADQKRTDILNFLAYIEHKANVCKRLKVQQSFHVHVISVHPLYRGQKIASKLFESSIVIAKAKNFTVISVSCTSLYTSKIAESFAMECISTVTYQEYNNYIGKCLFIPNPPHKEIKSFVKRL